MFNSTRPGNYLENAQYLFKLPYSDLHDGEGLCLDIPLDAYHRFTIHNTVDIAMRNQFTDSIIYLNEANLPFPYQGVVSILLA
jgi:hypothetical protein